jgi:acetate kinase
MNILVLNAGSSSFKSSLYRLSETDLPLDSLVPLWTGTINWNSTGTAILKAKTADESIESSRTRTNRTQDIHDLLDWLWSGKTQVVKDIHAIDIVGHRVVHGGDKYRQPISIDAEVKAEIDRLSIYAPLHNRANLIGIEAIESLSTNVIQLAVFDTAFFGDLPEVAYTYSVPYQWLERGIRKYGFHGTSHQYCTRRAAQLLGRDLADLKLISCHLGNGCSIASVKFGRCIDTTMGFTPLDGLMMGTRCGSIDPGIILHLLREGEYTVEELDRILNFESGLLGVSGVSNDVREIDRAIASGNVRAKLALEMYIDRATAKIGSLLPALDGVDAIVFAGGVGEHSAEIRAAIVSRLAFLGVEIDTNLNMPIPDEAQASGGEDRDLATPQSPVRLLAIHTQEEWEIARTCWQYFRG